MVQRMDELIVVTYAHSGPDQDIEGWAAGRNAASYSKELGMLGASLTAPFWKTAETDLLLTERAPAVA